MKNYNQDDHYIIQQINIASKFGATVIFLREKSFEILQVLLKDKIFEKYGRLPVLFSPFYNSLKFLGYGIENIDIQTSGGKRIIVCNL